MIDKIKRVFLVLSSRGGAAGLALLSSIFITRELSSEQSGSYFTVIAYSLFYSTVVSFGANGVSLLLSAKNTISSLSIAVYNIKCMAFRSFLFLPVFILFTILDFFPYQFNFYVFLIGAGFALSQSLQYILIANNKQVEAYFIHGCLSNVFIIIGVLTKDIDLALFFHVLSFFITSLLQFLIIKKNSPLEISIISNEFTSKDRFNYFQQDALGQIYTSLTLVFASWYLKPHDIAILAVLLKLSSVCNIFIGAVNTVFYPDAIKMYMSGHLTALKHLWFKNALLNVIFVMLYSLVLWFSWSFIIKTFKLEVNYFNSLALNFAYIFVGLSAFSQLFLNSTGKSGVVKNATWFTCFIGSVLINVTALLFGYDFVVYSLSLTLVIQSSITIYHCNDLSRGK
ncbi:hypothetical protein LF941_02870 [Pectobacterium versatile]|uniref:lipopolysaccharide biosynthesis protein n=1 Tax=Pectobacterium versatile TaxID=2488639 RepID=UPI000C7F6BD8|nr:hypothetical protein [Pectobacterium versatile]MCA6914331.1 hypothetical protein [Pectobacterium versatile]PLY38646.1 hypothetical protein F164LOC_02165 [Pectobacterium carotovorum]